MTGCIQTILSPFMSLQNKLKDTFFTEDRNFFKNSNDLKHLNENQFPSKGKKHDKKANLYNENIFEIFEGNISRTSIPVNGKKPPLDSIQAKHSNNSSAVRNKSAMEPREKHSKTKWQKRRAAQQTNKGSRDIFSERQENEVNLNTEFDLQSLDKAFTNDASNFVTTSYPLKQITKEEDVRKELNRLEHFIQVKETDTLQKCREDGITISKSSSNRYHDINTEKHITHRDIPDSDANIKVELMKFAREFVLNNTLSEGHFKGKLNKDQSFGLKGRNYGLNYSSSTLRKYSNALNDEVIEYQSKTQRPSHHLKTSIKSPIIAFQSTKKKENHFSISPFSKSNEEDGIFDDCSIVEIARKRQTRIRQNLSNSTNSFDDWDNEGTHFLSRKNKMEEKEFKNIIPSFDFKKENLNSCRYSFSDNEMSDGGENNVVHKNHEKTELKAKIKKRDFDEFQTVFCKATAERSERKESAKTSKRNCDNLNLNQVEESENYKGAKNFIHSNEYDDKAITISDCSDRYSNSSTPASNRTYTKSKKIDETTEHYFKDSDLLSQTLKFEEQVEEGSSSSDNLSLESNDDKCLWQNDVVHARNVSNGEKIENDYLYNSTISIDIQQENAKSMDFIQNSKKLSLQSKQCLINSSKINSENPKSKNLDDKEFSNQHFPTHNGNKEGSDMNSNFFELPNCSEGTKCDSERSNQTQEFMKLEFKNENNFSSLEKDDKSPSQSHPDVISDEKISAESKSNNEDSESDERRSGSRSDSKDILKMFNLGSTMASVLYGSPKNNPEADTPINETFDTTSEVKTCRKKWEKQSSTTAAHNSWHSSKDSFTPSNRGDSNDWNKQCHAKPSTTCHCCGNETTSINFEENLRNMLDVNMALFKNLNQPVYFNFVKPAGNAPPGFLVQPLHYKTQCEGVTPEHLLQTPPVYPSQPLVDTSDQQTHPVLCASAEASTQTSIGENIKDASLEGSNETSSEKLKNCPEETLRKGKLTARASQSSPLRNKTRGFTKISKTDNQTVDKLGVEDSHIDILTKNPSPETAMEIALADSVKVSPKMNAKFNPTKQPSIKANSTDLNNAILSPEKSIHLTQVNPSNQPREISKDNREKSLSGKNMASVMYDKTFDKDRFPLKCLGTKTAGNKSSSSSHSTNKVIHSSKEKFVENQQMKDNKEELKNSIKNNPRKGREGRRRRLGIIPGLIEDDSSTAEA
ncbi:serine-rich adhesin for platelets-like [Parasteatoda tepidariorum]|uniref:serine-rich adhesin for platelets-like n=1 Tax=Parasteatoda tepidariorum TaxID=114398 RepID=UPI0039BCACFB